MIVPTLARLIVREHLYKPIDGKVLLLGRQRMAMTYEQVLELFAQEGYSPSEDAQRKVKAALDEKSEAGKPVPESLYGETDFISDHAFFELLGVGELLAMDVSTYEGADIIHNLNLPVPESLYSEADFIIDGGTFDHLFDLRVAFENVVKLLRPGGRVLQWNAASNFTGDSYLSFGPDFFYDYFVLNQFTDCKVYVAEVDSQGQREMWDFYLYEGAGNHNAFRSSRIQMTLVLAEKGPSSTWDLMPVQAQYRDDHLWEPYRQGQKRISSSSRKPLTGSKKGIALAARRANRQANGSVFPLVKLTAAKVRERGLLWFAKRAAAKSYRLVKPSRRTTRPNNVLGFRYLGKI